MATLHKLKPYHLPKEWGYEEWLLSCYEGRLSEVRCAGKNIALPTFLNQQNIEENPNHFPLLIKNLQANEWLSVQLHPSDADGINGVVPLPNNRGKTECWLILKATPNAVVAWGLKKNYSKEQLQTMIQEETIVDAMHQIKVKEGDLVHVPAGTLHAIGGGIRLLEVQQSSDTTYRVHDFNRGRELHIKQSLAVIKPQKQLQPLHWQNFMGKLQTPYFSLENGLLKTKCRHKTTTTPTTTAKLSANLQKNEKSSAKKSSARTPVYMVAEKKIATIKNYCTVVALKGSLFVKVRPASTKKGIKDILQKSNIQLKMRANDMRANDNRCLILAEGEAAIASYNGLLPDKKSILPDKKSSKKATEFILEIYCVNSELENICKSQNNSSPGNKAGNTFYNTSVATVTISTNNSVESSQTTPSNNKKPGQHTQDPYTFTLTQKIKNDARTDLNWEEKPIATKNSSDRTQNDIPGELLHAHYAIICPFAAF